MDGRNKKRKGEHYMTNAVYFAHGLILGSLLTAWVAFMLRK
jgi:uncharacterized membrane protein